MTRIITPSIADPHHGLEQDVLQRILEVAHHLSASPRLTDILTVIINAMRDVLGAQRATLLEYDPARDELFSTVAHGLGDGGAALDLASVVRGEPKEIRISAGAGLAGACARQRCMINVPDAYADRRFNPQIDRETGFRTRSILAIPLVAAEGELIGVAEVLNKRSGTFSARDEQVAAALASLAAVAIKRGRLIEDRLVREKLERDLELARRIQKSTFPEQFPRLPGFDVVAWNEPAEATGGDAYDVIAHPRAASPRALLLLADATGHGVGPALSVTQVRAMLRIAVRMADAGELGLSGIVRHMNNQLCDDLPDGRFVTAWVGDIDSAARTLLSVSAGQAPLLWYRSARGSFEVLGADGPPLGVLPEIDVTPRTIPMEAGDVFAVISDGVLEALGPDGCQFGLDRAQTVIAEAGGGRPGRILSALQAAVASFTAGRPADDDRTAVIIGRSDRD